MRADVLMHRKQAHSNELVRRGQPCSRCRMQKQEPKHHRGRDAHTGQCESIACQCMSSRSFSGLATDQLPYFLSMWKVASFLSPSYR